MIEGEEEIKAHENVRRSSEFSHSNTIQNAHVQVDSGGRIVGSGGSLLESGDRTFRSTKTVLSQGSMDNHPKKEGYKWNPDTGEFEKLNETELARQKLLDELADLEQRMQELDQKGQLFPTDYDEGIEDADSESEPCSDDSLLADSRKNLHSSGSLGQEDSAPGEDKQQQMINVRPLDATLRANDTRDATPLRPTEEDGTVTVDFNSQSMISTSQKMLINNDSMGSVGGQGMTETSNHLVAVNEQGFSTHNGTQPMMMNSQTEKSAEKIQATSEIRSSASIENLRKGEKRIQHSDQNSMDEIQQREPDQVPGFKKLPFPVQYQLRALAKPRRDRTERDLNKLKLDVKEVEFFKAKQLDENTMHQIIASAGWAYVQKGKWVYSMGDKGNELYLLLHGHCQVMITNDEYLLFRRSFRDNLKQMYACVEKTLDTEKMIKKVTKNTNEYDELIQAKIACIKQQIKARRMLKVEFDQLNSQGKYTKVLDYYQGDSFGDDSLLHDDFRQDSILAAKSCFFLTITKDNYQRYLKSFDKKQKEAIVENFKQQHFLSGLSNQSILKLANFFKLSRYEHAGQYVLKEGDPVTHIALVKDGEFEVVKKNLRGIDERIMSFLRKGDVRKQIAQKVMLLPGRTSIYKKTNHLFTQLEQTVDDSFLQDKTLDIEQLAFNSVSDKLVEIARQQLETGSKQSNSLNTFKMNKIDRYKDIRVSINGHGYVFGDYDAYTGQKTYAYSLRSNRKGAQCYLMEKADFMRFCRSYHAMAKAFDETVYEKDRQMMRDLTRIVFNKWYSELVQENLKVVPDLNHNSSSKDAEATQEDEQQQQPAQKQTQIQLQKSPGNSRHGSPQKKLPPGIQKLSAEEIIYRSGCKTDTTILREREADEHKDHVKRMRSIESNGSQSSVTRQQAPSADLQNPPAASKNTKPKEKLASQLNTIMPMEIVRALPFFSRYSHNLRDQLDEYVHGLPATKAHRQIIAKAYNMPMEESSKEAAPEAKAPTEPIKFTTSVNEEQGTIDVQISDGELPVDPNRLKKAIKTALIKNENNPDKIDIQSIMREQTRIHKQIQDFKQSRSKAPVEGGVTNNYFSSHIVKKIAEDRIHKSLKEIHAKHQENVVADQLALTKQAQSTRRFEALQKSPTKFQKLLATKYNQGFHSVNEKMDSNRELTVMEKRIQTLNKQKTTSSRPITETLELAARNSEPAQGVSGSHVIDNENGSRPAQSPPRMHSSFYQENTGAPTSENLSQGGQGNNYVSAEVTFNHISHKKKPVQNEEALRKQTLSPMQNLPGNGDYQTGSPKFRQKSQFGARSSSQSMVEHLARSSHDRTEYTFFTNRGGGIADKRNSSHLPAYPNKKLANMAAITMRQNRFGGSQNKLVALQQTSQRMNGPGGATFVNMSMGDRILPMKGAGQGSIPMLSTNGRANAKYLGNKLINQNMTAKGARAGSNSRIQLAALFQPRDVRTQSQQGFKPKNPYN